MFCAQGYLAEVMPLSSMQRHRLKQRLIACAGLGTVRDAVGIVQDSGRAAADVAGLPHTDGDAEKLQKVSHNRLDF